MADSFVGFLERIARDSDPGRAGEAEPAPAAPALAPTEVPVSSGSSEAQRGLTILLFVIAAALVLWALR